MRSPKISASDDLSFAPQSISTWSFHPPGSQDFPQANPSCSVPCTRFSLKFWWRGQLWRISHCTKDSAALISRTPRIPARTEKHVNTVNRQGTVPRPPIWKIFIYRIISSPTESFCHLKHLQLPCSRCQVDSQCGFCKSHPKYDLEKKMHLLMSPLCTWKTQCTNHLHLYHFHPILSLF